MPHRAVRFEPLPQPITLGISSCLLGQNVRFDGSHKRDPFINDQLSRYFRFAPFCPEVAIGLGIPRPPIRLVYQRGEVRVKGVRNPELDVTEPLRHYANVIGESAQEFSGYIWKSKSPSCGMDRVRLYEAKDGAPLHQAGLVSQQLQQRFPHLPMEEEGRLHDPVLRENFITRVFAYARWQQLADEGFTPAAIIRFHTRHKLLLMSHNEASYRRLGRMVAGIKNEQAESWRQAYLAEFMSCLTRKPNRKRQANVLQHVMGHFKTELQADDKSELNECIDQYRLGKVPLIVPITLLQNILRRFPSDYLQEQYYFAPYPEDLGLRNQL